MLTMFQIWEWWFQPSPTSPSLSGSPLSFPWAGCNHRHCLLPLRKPSAPAGPHRLDVVSESDGPVPALAPSSLLLLPAVPLPTKPLPRGRPRPPVKSWDVYVGDFLGMVQGNWEHRRHAKRFLMHTLDKVFRPPDLQDNPHRQDPASVKKM
jgi:hypothetical protein